MTRVWDVFELTLCSRKRDRRDTGNASEPQTQQSVAFCGESETDVFGILPDITINRLLHNSIITEDSRTDAAESNGGSWSQSEHNFVQAATSTSFCQSKF